MELIRDLYRYLLACGPMLHNRNMERHGPDDRYDIYVGKVVDRIGSNIS